MRSIDKTKKDSETKMKAKRVQTYESRKKNPDFLAYRRTYHRKRYAKSAKAREAEILRQREWRANNPEESRRRTRESHARRRYGMTTTERNDLFKSQGKRCPICKTDKCQGGGFIMDGQRTGFTVDHCHKTKRVRGIICHHCNLVLGHARDSVEVLSAAIAYLKGATI